MAELSRALISLPLLIIFTAVYGVGFESHLGHI